MRQQIAVWTKGNWKAVAIVAWASWATVMLIQTRAEAADSASNYSELVEIQNRVFEVKTKLDEVSDLQDKHVRQQEIDNLARSLR